MTSREKKITQSIQECDTYIEKEGRRAEDLRPKEVKDRLEFYKNHREKLVAML